MGGRSSAAFSVRRQATEVIRPRVDTGAFWTFCGEKSRVYPATLCKPLTRGRSTKCNNRRNDERSQPPRRRRGRSEAVKKVNLLIFINFIVSSKPENCLTARFYNDKLLIFIDRVFRQPLSSWFLPRAAATLPPTGA